MQFVVIGSFSSRDRIHFRPSAPPAPGIHAEANVGDIIETCFGFYRDMLQIKSMGTNIWQKMPQMFREMPPDFTRTDRGGLSQMCQSWIRNGIFLNVTYPGWHVRELSQAWDLKMDICHLEKKWLKIGCSVLTCSFWFQKPSGHIKSNDLVITVIVWVGDFLELVQLTLNTPAWSQRRSLWRGPVWDKVMILESWWDVFLPTLFQPFWSKSKNR